MPQQRWLPYVVLLAAVGVMSTAAILIRLAQEQGVPSLSVAAGRLGLAALLLTLPAWIRAGATLRRLTGRDSLLGLAAGVFLALHFAAWISSLEYTSVASSVALVATGPLWTGLLSWLFLRERLTRALAVAIGLTLGGSILIGLSDAGVQLTFDGGIGYTVGAQSAGSNPPLGNLLALLGALAMAGYFLVGRDLRRRLALLPYIWLAYSGAALLLLGLALVSGTPLMGFAPPVYLLLLALAVGPQLLGHTALNWSLRFFSATFVAVALLGEPLGAALLALVVFGEPFAGLQLTGFGLLLSGIYLAIIGERRENQAQSA